MKLDLVNKFNFMFSKSKNKFDLIKSIGKYFYRYFFGNYIIIQIQFEQNGITLEHHTNYKFENDYILSKYLVKKNGMMLKIIPQQFKNNDKIVKYAIKQNGIALKYTSNENKSNYQMVKHAVKNDGLSLEYVSEELKNNFNIVKYAIGKNLMALIFSSARLKSNRKIFKYTIEDNKNLSNSIEQLEEYIKSKRESDYKNLNINNQLTNYSIILLIL